MDWTGGTRKRFAGSRGKTAPSQAQKAHFARVRSHRSRPDQTDYRSSATSNVLRDHAHGAGVKRMSGARSLPYSRGARSSSQKHTPAYDDQRRPALGARSTDSFTGDRYGNRNIIRQATEARRAGDELDDRFSGGTTSFDLELQLMQRRNARLTDQDRMETLLSRPLKPKRPHNSAEHQVGRRRRVETEEPMRRRGSTPRPTAPRPLFCRSPADTRPDHIFDSLQSAEIEFRIGSNALYSQSRSPETPRPHTSLRALSSRDHRSSFEEEILARSQQASQPIERYIGGCVEQMEEREDFVHSTASLSIVVHDAQSDEYDLPNLPSPILRPWTENDGDMRQEHQSGSISPRPLWPSLANSLHYDDTHETPHDNHRNADDRAWRDMMNVSHTSEGATSTRSIASGQDPFLSESSVRLSLPDPFESWQQGQARPFPFEATSASDVNGFCGKTVSTSAETSPWRKFVFGTSRDVERGVLSSPGKISTVESWSHGTSVSPLRFPSPVVSGLGTSICGNAEDDFSYRY